MRLYVGGLSHLITQKDVKDRFGKFGEVEEVELRTRRDEDGVPYKTFGYININISDADLKRCLTVMNKSKWKGGTLQIEVAKESFLHRLAEERRAAVEQRLQPPAAEDQRQKMLQSLSKAGVENFTMKAAVPGTEVPGHKDWVVSKFGRVLPVLQLRCQRGSRARTLRYNPSKYCHNIRRLEQGTHSPPTPVAQLTWQVQGGDDDISKKRRGEFPPFKLWRPKKARTDLDSHAAAGDSSLQQDVVRSEVRPVANGREQPANHRAARRRWAEANDSDVDSEEEIRRAVEAERSRFPVRRQEVDDSNLEVVGLDYVVTPGRRQQNGFSADDEEADYDSADTDELFTSRKPGRLAPPTAEQLPGNATERKRRKMKNEEGQEKARGKKRKVLPAACDEEEGSADEEEGSADDEEGSADDEEGSADDEEGSADDASDSDYDAMISSVPRLEISLADLQKMAAECEAAAPICSSSSPPCTSAPAAPPPPKKGTTPEEILASLLGEDDSDGESKKKKKKKKRGFTVLPAFMGTRALEDEEEEQKEVQPPVQALVASEEEEQVEEVQAVVTHFASLSSDAVKTPAAPSDSSTSQEEEQDEEQEEVQSPVNAQVQAAEKEVGQSVTTPSSSDAVKVPAAAESDSSSQKEQEEQKEVLLPPSVRAPLPAEEEEERQRRANLRRLAAVQQRQREAEEHKKLIQGALTKLDAPAAGKHIVFGSDEEEEEPQSTAGTSKKDQDQDQDQEQKPSARQLFEEDGDEEEDGGSFSIRPHFEGRAGQKLMALQSRFGADERFRMDSRFLEDQDQDQESGRERSVTEEDEALEGERRKNLSILESVLGSSQQGSSRTPVKTFRDVSALHYDPSREEHAAFERDAAPVQESKASRRKKREEAQTHPEVSKEIHYDVSGDLKAVFGSAKDGGGGGGEQRQKTSWDQDEGGEGEGKVEEPLSGLLSSKTRADSNKSGFKFSFFGDDVETGSREEEYRAELIQAPRVSWQQDPRFHDSSSEEEPEEEPEEESEDDGEEPRPITATTTGEECPGAELLFFFFGPDDGRLTDGPRWFCRSSQLEEQRERWEETRSALRQEYRKKHRDARRRLKSSQRS